MGSSFKHYRQQSMGQLHFLGFLFSWLNWTMKSAKMRTLRLIMICDPQYVEMGDQIINQVMETDLYLQIIDPELVFNR